MKASQLSHKNLTAAQMHPPAVPPPVPPFTDPSPPRPSPVLHTSCHTPCSLAESSRRGHSHTDKDLAGPVTALFPSWLPTRDRAQHPHASRAKEKPGPLVALAPGEACPLGFSTQASPPETCALSHSQDGTAGTRARSFRQQRPRSTVAEQLCTPGPGSVLNLGWGLLQAPAVASQSPPPASPAPSTQHSAPKTTT